MSTGDVVPLGVTRPEPISSTRDWVVARILLVIADEVWARRAGEVLRAERFEVDALQDGPAALERVVSQRPDVVGVDLSRADGSGPGLCRDVRARTSAALFAVGPWASEADIVSALTAGADTFIPKDVGRAELVARLRALVRRVDPRVKG